MIHDYQIAESDVLLRPLEERDALRMRILRNQKRHCFLTQQEITEEQQMRWYRSYLLKNDDYMFAVTDKDNPSLFIGAIGLYDITDGAAEVGRVIIDKENFPKKGIGGQAVRAVCAIGFARLSLKCIYAKVLPNNIASLTMFRKLHFPEVGMDGGCIRFEITKELFEDLYGNYA